MTTATRTHALLRRDGTGWSNPKILIIFLLVFVLGAAFGAAGVRSLLHARMEARPSPSANFTYLSQQLHLTDDQKVVVMRVLDDYAKYYENLETDRENVAEHGKQEILKCLRPDQQQLFQKIFRSPALPGRRVTNE